MKATRIVVLIVIALFACSLNSCIVVKRDRYGSHYRLNKKDAKHHKILIQVGPNKGKSPRVNSKGHYQPKPPKK